MTPIFFTPLYKERVWGGVNLAHKLKRKLPSDKIIGESWELVDRQEDQSIIREGQYQGLTLRTALEKHAMDIMGPKYNPNRPFPILIKWLDCQDRLSLQVHPPANIAQQLKGEAKSEVWYIADTNNNAQLMLGLKAGVNQEAFEHALLDNTLESLIHTCSVKTGDAIFVWSGRIHAIGSGNLILEIQQNSDTTYRVYDWGRVGLDGKPRDLHIQKSMASIDFNDYEPEPLRNTQDGDIIADCEAFRIRKETFKNKKNLTFSDKSPAVLVSVVKGEIIITSSQKDTLYMGDTVLLPHRGEFSISGSAEAEILLTDGFV